jgi:phospholipid-binding lipoprotein MlaA
MAAIRISLLLACLAFGGCASTNQNPKDPLESFNRGMYQFNDTLDKAVTKPVAQGYNAVVPPPLKLMVSNFFSNLNDITVAINNLLQFKIVEALSDGGRVVVNTTVGMFGVADVASAVGLKKHNEDFGQTLGHWGVNSGPYLVLPFFGPSSVRDGAGLVADSSTNPLRMIDPVDERNQIIAAGVVDKRAILLNKEEVLDTAALDRYTFIRDAYLQRRQSLVYDGDPPREKFEDEEGSAEPDKSSSGDNAGNAQSADTEAAPLAVPAIPAGAEPIEPQLLPVRRVWLTQQETSR